jgi:hypothetical protein
LQLLSERGIVIVIRARICIVINTGELGYLF